MTPILVDQLGASPIFKHIVRLNKDRTSGEYIPELSGQYLRVESVDYPCRISFNNLGYDQSVPCIPGLIVEGAFRGVTMWHDNYGASFRGVVRFALAIGAKYFHDTDAVGTTLPLASSLGSLFPSSFSVSLFVPQGYRKLSGSILLTVSNLSQPVQAIVTARFGDANLINYIGAGVSRPLPIGNFGGLTTTVYQNLAPFSLVGTNLYAARVEFENIAIPHNAEYLQFIGNYPAVTSADSLVMSGFAS